MNVFYETLSGVLEEIRSEGKRVKELRIQKKLSQKGLAEQLQLAGHDFNDLTILRIEQGTRFVPDYEVVAIAEFFRVSCEYLLGVSDQK